MKSPQSQSNKFDFQRFEKSRGLDFLYFAKWAEEHTIGKDFTDYFFEKSKAFDDDHLEIALSLLGKTKTPEAFHEIAKYMRHSNPSIRLFSINTISHQPSIDETIMPYVVSTLANPVDDLGIRGLREAFERYSNKGTEAC